jgi:hypothetical protein
VLESGLSKSGDSRLFERKGLLRRLKEGRLRLPSTKNDLKSVNHFPKFTKHFLSNENHFLVGHYFRPYQTSENAEIIFQKLFYAETNRA